MHRLWLALLLVLSLTPSQGAASEALYAGKSDAPALESREWKLAVVVKANLVAAPVLPRFDGPSRLPLYIPSGVLPRRPVALSGLGLVPREPSVHGVDAVPPCCERLPYDATAPPSR